MPSKPRRIKLDDSQVEILKGMYLNGENFDSIAAAIGVDRTKVKMFISQNRKELGLPARGRGKSAQTKETATTITQREKDPKYVYWINALRQSKRYERVKPLFVAEDLDYFEQQWAFYHLALEDMSVAEEDVLENLVIFKLRIDQNQKSLKEIQVLEQDLRTRLAGRSTTDLDLNDPNDRALFAAIQQNNTAMVDVNKDLNVLSATFQNLQKHLNVSREQREQKRNIGSDTFLGLIKKFNDRDIRKSIGEYNERMRIATDKKLNELKKPYTYMDGSIEPIILDGSDFQKE